MTAVAESGSDKCGAVCTVSAMTANLLGLSGVWGSRRGAR